MATPTCSLHGCESPSCAAACVQVAALNARDFRPEFFEALRHLRSIQQDCKALLLTDQHRFAYVGACGSDIGAVPKKPGLLTEPQPTRRAASARAG